MRLPWDGASIAALVTGTVGLALGVASLVGWLAAGLVVWAPTPGHATVTCLVTTQLRGGDVVGT